MPDQPDATGLAARTSASTPSTRRTSATRSGSGCVRWARSAVNSRPSATIRLCPAAEYAAARPGIADRVGQAGRVGVGGGLRDDLLGGGVVASAESSSSTARRHSAAMSRPPSRHRGPVSTRIAAAPAVGSATSRSIATRSATSGTASNPASADDLDGHAARRKRVGHRRGIGVAAHQHRRRRCGRHRRCGRRGRSARKWSATQSRSAATSFSSAHRMAPGWRVGPRPQLPHRHRTPPRLGGHRVGQMQRPRRIAPAGAQLQRRRRGFRPPAGNRW